MIASKIKTTESGRPIWSDKSKAQQRAYMAWWRAINRENYNKNSLMWANKNRKKRTMQARRSYLKRQFKLSLEEFTALLKEQKGKCSICSKKITKASKDTLGRLVPTGHIDHDHKTGKIRGILCFNCNTGLGHFKDDYIILLRAAKYLRERTIG